jgi:hypothetical protein
MNRQHILDEIVRTAAENGGLPLGHRRFLQETGIRVADWEGRYWARWSDVLRDAGFEPNQLVEPRDDATLLKRFADLAMELGRIPVSSEMRLKKRSDPDFPNDKTFSRAFGNKNQLLERLREYCSTTTTYAPLIPLIDATVAPEPHPTQDDAPDEQIGFIYMLKAGRYYKVGRSNSFERRSRELAIQLPEKAETIHVIRTDDPIGIELYWHRRFEAKRLNGEWFELSSADVKAFKRRKFM